MITSRNFCQKVIPLNLNTDKNISEKIYQISENKKIGIKKPYSIKKYDINRRIVINCLYSEPNVKVNKGFQHIKKVSSGRCVDLISGMKENQSVPISVKFHQLESVDMQMNTRNNLLKDDQNTFIHTDKAGIIEKYNTDGLNDDSLESINEYKSLSENSQYQKPNEECCSNSSSDSDENMNSESSSSLIDNEEIKLTTDLHASRPEDIISDQPEVKPVLVSKNLQDNEKKSVCELQDDKEPINIRITPKGFQNPKGFCFLNCIVQLLLCCNNFVKEILNTTFSHEKCQKPDDCRFTDDFRQLVFEYVNENMTGVENSMSKIQFYFQESSTGDDVHKCFMNLLKKIQTCSTKSSNMPLKINSEELEKEDEIFNNYRNRNMGIIFDLFYGQIKFNIICKECNQVFNEKFQLIKSMALPLEVSSMEIPISKCLALFLEKSKIEFDEDYKNGCLCSKDNLFMETKITHTPNYLFIYLNRGTYSYNGFKNNIHVTCGGSLDLPTTKGIVNYNLISVIDHIGTHTDGHYYAKCCYNNIEWWILNDFQVERINYSVVGDIITQKSIAFLFKKNSHVKN